MRLPMPGLLRWILPSRERLRVHALAHAWIAEMDLSCFDTKPSMDDIKDSKALENVSGRACPLLVAHTLMTQDNAHGTVRHQRGMPLRPLQFFSDLSHDSQCALTESQCGAMLQT